MSWEPDVSRVALGDRALFPDLAAEAYLSHAAISPASSEVVRAAGAYTGDYARRGSAPSAPGATSASGCARASRVC
ncbi:MAG: hypothetical protein M5U28_49815 [Sandaracinaceae bacterium]|nr:hypothetical protein [Sandaracinaceae bacterium]